MEDLPFADDGFDGGLASLTLHHWHDINRGLSEFARVVSKRLVIFSWDPRRVENFWLINDYIPEILEFDLPRFPVYEDFLRRFPSAQVEDVPIPKDCSDGFLGAYWQRPTAYLDKRAQKGISSFQQLSPALKNRGLSQLKADLDSGVWLKRYGFLMTEQTLDLGYRLIVIDV